MANSESRQKMLLGLRSKLQAVTDTSSVREDPETIDTHVNGPFAALLPWGYRDRGTLMEWLVEGEGHGALWLAFKLAAESLEGGGVVVTVDLSQEFYPPAATALGISLDRLVLLHPRSQSDALWGLEQSLRCPGVAAVVCRLGRLDPRAYRRLQLAAESGGGVGMLVRPAHYRREPCWADVRLQVRASSVVSETDAPDGRRLQVEVLHRRVGTSGATVELEICDAPICVRMVPGLVPAKAARRATGA